MGFLDLFRPKWRHSDATVRAEAVRDLDNDDTLKRVAMDDPDPRVRRLALKKLDDPKTLLTLAERDADEGLRKAAGERAVDLLTTIASYQLVPLADTLTWKSSSPVVPISARPEKPF